MDLDKFARAVKRLYYTDGCAYVYLILIAVNVGLICWTLALPGGYDGGVFFLIMQGLLNVVLVVEVWVRYITSPDNFWIEWSNIFDIIVMILAIATHFLYIIAPTDYETAEDSAVLMRIIRDGFQFLRLGVFLKNRRNSEPYHMVDFNDLDDIGAVVPVRFQDDPLLKEQCDEMSQTSELSRDDDDDMASHHSLDAHNRRHLDVPDTHHMHVDIEASPTARLHSMSPSESESEAY
mmetsp:Transcript_8331/g.15455  ORF Transcript_8331/g.15455 Transcript_8331/m.15455 type:complete len:235 (-) Transcript_8331:244-948(-)|eukprot:CAMPEP_0197517046 /NCGR_PEP_ID=MMETSP1318-20131121/2005_1 /TAXON_ID=552666 /ORGANISM="Partenskyella glossopodia, Strain RCC365" /LENGTH=234 /DNA_ID=CAMNT_0043066279 /DNA_START=89 /DNA_END=793 /DNA_ORIENTATION=+